MVVLHESANNGRKINNSRYPKASRICCVELLTTLSKKSVPQKGIEKAKAKIENKSRLQKKSVRSALDFVTISIVDLT